MPDKTKIKSTIIDILKDQPLNPDKLAYLATDPDDFDITDVSLDSLEVLVFCLELEDRFEIEFEPTELENLPKLSDLVGRVAEILGENAA